MHQVVTRWFNSLLEKAWQLAKSKDVIRGVSRFMNDSFVANHFGATLAVVEVVSDADHAS